MPISRDDRSFVQSLERGLAMLHAFDAEHARLTLREAAEATGFSRPAARRLLLTLEALGYISSDGSTYQLTSRVLTLGYGYIASRSIHEVAERHLERFSASIGESSSLSMLDETDVVFVVRVPTHRIMNYKLSVGARLPAYVSAHGRVLLANISDEALDRYFRQAKLLRFNSRTCTSEVQLRAALAKVRSQGWAMIDQEFETNVRAIGAPVRDAAGLVVAAIGCSCHAGRVSIDQLSEEFLPCLRETAAAITADLGGSPEGSPGRHRTPTQP
jgi:IclR family transcriptional regulator, pca regulon regulatory protein